MDYSSRVTTRRLSKKEGLALLHKQCNRRFWGIPGDEMDHYRSVVRDPPQEMFQPCSVQSLALEYCYLRQWLRGVRDQPYAFDFFKVHECQVQKVGPDDQLLGKPFAVQLSDIAGASHWRRRLPKKHARSPVRCAR